MTIPANYGHNQQDCAQRLYNPALTGIAPPTTGYNSRTVGFRGLDTAKTTSILQIQPDIVEFSAKESVKEKKKLSKPAKLAIGLGGALTTVVAATFLISKHQTNKLTKLYKEKMTLVNLPEKLEFKEAKTVEEGIKFAKEILGIKEVDKAFEESLEAINFANKGLVDVANANKGKLFMPKKLCYETMEDDVVAYVIQSIKSSRFGELAINKKCFDNILIDKELKGSLFHNDGIKRFILTKDNRYASNIAINQMCTKFEESVTPLISKYYENASSLNLNEKRLLLESLREEFKTVNCVNRYPMYFIKKNTKLFEKQGVEVPIDELINKTPKEQTEFAKNALKQAWKKTGRVNIIDVPIGKPEKDIYHEMGHLQDYAKNLKELDIKFWKFPSLKEIWNDVKQGKKHSRDSEVFHVENRWGGITYDGYKELLEKNPEKFKKRFPDLYEFLTNTDTQQIAGKVSGYSQTSIGEFIAESYAEMIAGHKLPDDVMKLYRKYNGPELP